MWFNQQAPLGSQQAPSPTAPSSPEEQRRKLMAGMLAQQAMSGGGGGKGGIASSALAGALAGYMQRKPGINYDPLSGTNGILNSTRGSGD